jgi:hypothetical protein
MGLLLVVQRDEESVFEKKGEGKWPGAVRGWSENGTGLLDWQSQRRENDQLVKSTQ